MTTATAVKPDWREITDWIDWNFTEAEDSKPWRGDDKAYKDYEPRFKGVIYVADHARLSLSEPHSVSHPEFRGLLIEIQLKTQVMYSTAVCARGFAQAKRSCLDQYKGYV